MDHEEDLTNKRAKSGLEEKLQVIIQYELQINTLYQVGN